MERVGFPASVRAGLPAEAQAYVATLEAAVGAVPEHVTALQGQVATLQAALAAAEARARQHSGTSSRPPSSDPPAAPKRPAPPPRGRRRGGQPGYPGHQRPLVALDQVTRIEVHRRATCPACQQAAPAEATPVGEPARQPVWEVPPLAPEVIEHQDQAVRCPGCQHAVPAPTP